VRLCPDAVKRQDDIAAVLMRERITTRPPGQRSGQLGHREEILKRILDLAWVMFLFPIWVPVFGLVAVLVALTSPGAILYVSKRLGRHGRYFSCYKFRSMRLGAHAERHALVGRATDGPLFKMKDDPRVTALGRWLRRTSLDELPQLINVLHGEMSLVGPRPLPKEDIERETHHPDFAEWRRIREEAPPGITGLWQVSGRSDASFARMVALDRVYVQRWSVWLDLKILVRTIPAVLKARGAY